MPGVQWYFGNVDLAHEIAYGADNGLCRLEDSTLRSLQLSPSRPLALPFALSFVLALALSLSLSLSFSIGVHRYLYIYACVCTPYI